MHRQHRQYVIVFVVFLTCASSVFFGIKSILRDKYETTTFAVGDWEGITLPRYHGPAVYSSPTQRTYSVTMPMTSTSTRVLFHHNVSPAYRIGRGAITKSSPINGVEYKLYQTSNQVAHVVGSGSGEGTTSGYSSTTNTPHYSSVAIVNMPTLVLAPATARMRTLANNNIITTTTTPTILADVGTIPNYRTIGLRRDKPAIPEEEIEPGTHDPSGDWYWDGEDWISVHTEGATKIEDGKVYRWNGTSWEHVSDQSDNFDTPIGNIPCLLLLLLATAYATYKQMKRRNILATTANS